MGASIYLSEWCDHCGTVSRGYGWDYTYNLSPMQREALGGETLHGDKPDVPTFIARLRTVVAAFDADPDHFMAFNPTNGWGDYEGFLEAARDALAWIDEASDEKRIRVEYWL